MVFKKSLAALLLVIPLALGIKPILQQKFDVLTMIAASPSELQERSACSFLGPIVDDLIENLFDNQCGDTVSPLTESTHYEHLSKDRTTGSWCSASCFP